MTPNIADHFDMPDAEQEGDRAEHEGYNLAPGHGYRINRSYEIFSALQQLDTIQRTLAELQLPAVAAIVNEAVTALGMQWLDEREQSHAWKNERQP